MADLQQQKNVRRESAERSLKARWRWAMPVSIAVASVSLAAALRLLFLQSLGFNIPYVTFFPAVMLAAVYGGTWSGLLATALSATIIDYCWIEPMGAHALMNPVASLGMAIFAGNGILISWITCQWHRAKLRAAVAEAEIKYAAEREVERRKTDDSLRKLSLAVEQSPVTIMITDTNGNIEFVNPMFTELTGYSKEEVLGKNPHVIKMDDVSPESQDDQWHTISSGNLWEGEFHNKNKSGELFWEKVKISPLRNSEGVVTNFIAIKENITNQKIAEEQLCRSEERFRQLFDQSNDAIIILNVKDYSILNFNDEAEKIFGYSREELRGKPIFPLMANPDRVFSNAENLEKSYWQIDKMSMLKRDGTNLLVSTRFKMITLNADEVLYCSFRDITDRVRIEDEALAAQANMIQADKMASLGLLVSGMAHEINNPNNCVLFNAELLAKTWNSALPILEEFYRQNGEFKLGSFKFSETRDIIPKLFSGLVDGAERIRSIVDMLKDFARQDNGDTRVSFDVNKVITNAIAIVNHEIKKRCNYFYLETSHEVPPAFGNAQQIEQVMINLIINALQSLQNANCSIRINTALAEDDEHIVITVVDEGEGMSAEVLEHLTDPFFTTRSDSGGTGLGLSISAAILQKNEGTISFVSAPGKGTTARIELRIFADLNQRGIS